MEKVEGKGTGRGRRPEGEGKRESEKGEGKGKGRGERDNGEGEGKGRRERERGKGQRRGRRYNIHSPLKVYCAYNVLVLVHVQLYIQYMLKILICTIDTYTVAPVVSYTQGWAPRSFPF